MKIIITIITAFFITVSIWAQSPEKMSYQAIVRNSTDNLVSNQTIGMKISILQSGTTGTTVYAETQTPTTNTNGLVSLEIGTGTIVSGNFANIDWSNNTYFVKTEIDLTGGTNYTITSTSQLLSVPYALYAKTAGTVSETDPVYGASAASGITTTNITNWNTAYSWGDHASAGYLTADQTGNSGKYLTTNGITPSWATLTKTTVGLGNVENTALSTWAGSGNITTVGTITSGTWQGSLTNGKMYIGNGSGVASEVAVSGDISLSNTGVAAIQNNSVDGTNIALGNDVQGDIMYYNGTDWVRLPAGTAGQVLQTNGSGANPNWVDAASGGSSGSAVIKSANYTIQAGETVIISNATATITFTLPSAASAGSGAVLHFYGITNNFNINSSEGIYDLNGALQTSLTGKYTAILVSDGINRWYQIK